MTMLTFLRTLRGKLILTYTTVTVLALLALEITLLTAVLVFSRGASPLGLSTDPLAYLSDVIAVLPSGARPYLRPGAADLAGLEAWVQATYDGGYASLAPQGPWDSPAAEIVQSDVMLVLSPGGTVLAAAPASARGLVGRQYSPPSNLARGTEILDHAMQMDLQAGDLAAVRPDGSYLMAIPVGQGQREGPLAGVIIVAVKAPPRGIGQWAPAVLRIVLATGLLLLLAVAPFGALFGLVMSRGLTRRLQALASAADAWSEGDFSVQPSDRSRDEISYLGVRMRRMAEHIQALLQTQQALALMEERNRLARELHDTVKQETFAVLMQVRAARNLLERDAPAARKHLVQAEELIKTSQQDLAAVIAELRPAALEGRGLATALGDYLAAWSQRSRIPADLQVQDECPLPLEVEQALYRVAQEALSNVARHSRASAVAVRLNIELGQVALSVVDNGTGFDPAAAGSGLGLQSMRDRMSRLGGRLVLAPAPDGGAVVTASAPIPSQEQC